MPLSPRTQFGAYEVLSFIGRGGMGEVYRARDTRLGRDVALKTLPDEDASNPSRRTRFEREARALASLNHPNIAAIYGFEVNGFDQPGAAPMAAIVMELVEGETLRERLARGPLPLDDALKLAAQIAAALEAAHLKGIVHRDLKPANVKLTAAGEAKVLDFGIAKILTDTEPDVTLSEVTAPAAVLGTPAYMAPEQAQGRPVDKRADVWAFGVLLYEMVTGERLVRGESRQDMLAAVLTVEPQWERVPPIVRPLLRACLQRDPLKRMRDIGDYQFLLAPTEPVGVRAPRSAVVWWVVAVATLAAVGFAFLAGRSFRRHDPVSPSAPIRFSTMLPTGVSVTRGPGYTSSVAVSPDGRTVVIAASDVDGQRLYRRSLDHPDAAPLAGTDGATSPFFSWDGKWIGFFAEGRLKRIPAAGGASADIAEAPAFSSGASWGSDDRIVFAYGLDSNLHVVAAEGGPVETIAANTTGREPEVLPDGRTVLFESAGQIHAYNRQTQTITKLFPGAAPRYTNGHVIFSRGTTLLAAPFHPEGPSAGAAIPLVEDVAVELPGSGGGRHYAVSRSGALVYVPAARAYELVVVSAGTTERVVGEPQRSLENPRFSPDGRHVVVAARRRDDEPADLWLHDLVGGAATRLTTNGGRAPIWSADGNAIVYSHLGDGQGIYSTRVDGVGRQQLVLALKTFHWLVGSTPDGDTLLYGVIIGRQSSIVAQRRDQSRTVVEPGSKWGGRLSRDGKWLTYYTLESGTFEVYVMRFPEGGRPWLIGEGTDPTWSPDGNQIYYRRGPRLISARVDKTAGVKVAATRVVVDPFLPPLYDDYDVDRDGNLVIVRQPTGRRAARSRLCSTGSVTSAAQSGSRHKEGLGWCVEPRARSAWIHIPLDN